MDLKRVLTAVLSILIATCVVHAGEIDSQKAREKLDKNGHEFTAEAFVKSIDHGESAIVELYLAAGMDANSRDNNGRAALNYAAENNDGVMTKMLIVAGADVNVTTEKGDTPLCDAADEQAHGSVSALIAAGADVNQKDSYGNPVIWGGVALGYVEVVRTLLNAGASLGEHRDAMIESAKAYPAMVELLKAAPK